MARRRPPNVHGLAVVDKPAGVTSHDVVDMARRRFGERQVGHAGTLDPDATGVLLVGVGKVTRLLRFLTALGKRYTGEVVLGVETSTLDAAGEVTATHDMSGVTVAEARAVAAEHLTGSVMQVPPMVSAIKIDGKRLHELAREGIEVDRPARPVTIHRLDIDATGEPGVLAIDVSCSSGTYVRSIAADLGRLLGGGAHLRRLRRTAVGPFTADAAAPIDTVELLSPAAAMAAYPDATVDDATTALVRNGRVLPAWPGEGPWAVLDPAGQLLAMYEPFPGRPGLAKPAVVIADPPQ